MKATIEWITDTIRWCFKKINRIDKTLARLTKKKYNKIRQIINEGYVTVNAI